MTEKQKAIIEARAQEIYKPHPDRDEFWYPNSSIMPLRIGAFNSGAEAMDELDKWISVDDELPPAIEGSKRSKEVLVLAINEYYVDEYDYRFNQWTMFGVTHWQPIQPPKK